MGTEVIITDPEENSVGIIVNENPTQVDVYIHDHDIPVKVEIIVDEFASQRAVDASHAAELILQQMLELISDNQPDGLILVKEILRNENVFTFQAGEIWRVSRNNYSNDVDFVTEIEPEETNLKRMDIVGGTPFGYQKISGPSSEDIVIPPDVPEDFVVRKIFNISGPDIDDSTPPITADAFIQKSEFSELVLISSGIIGMVVSANVGGIRFEGTNSSFQCVFVPDPQNLWIGKPFDVINSQNNELTIENKTGPGLQFSFPDNQNFVMQPYERTPFRWNFSSANVWVLEYVGSYPNYTPQKTIVSNLILDNSYNGKIVKVKSNATITIPSTLKKDFSCVFRTFTGAVATFVGGVGVTLDAQKGLILEPFKMATLFKDGNFSYFVLEGELKI